MSENAEKNVTIPIYGGEAMIPGEIDKPGVTEEKIRQAAYLVSRNNPGFAKICDTLSNSAIPEMTAPKIQAQDLPLSQRREIDSVLCESFVSVQGETTKADMSNKQKRSGPDLR